MTLAIEVLDLQSQEVWERDRLDKFQEKGSVESPGSLLKTLGSLGYAC